MIPLPKNTPARILLLSAYDATSHRHWRHQLTRMLPGCHWQQLSLPPRHFSWRLRGNSLSWGFGETALLNQPWDLLLCTSMTDLSALRGFVPALAQVPTLVYFHENQFAYPYSKQARGAVEQQMLSIYTALCADRLVFNSRFNRDSFHQGASALLQRLPDAVPAGLAERLHSPHILPVPIDDKWYQTDGRQPQAADALNIAWNHRWEYDKGPERLLHLVSLLIQSGLRFRLHLMGQQFRQQPPAFGQLSNLLQQHYAQHDLSPGQFGHVADEMRYRQLLLDSDIILSTADHDFQGLSVLEASACGCTPLAPAHQAYPEYLPPTHLYPAAAEGVHVAVARLRQWAVLKQQGLPLPSVSVDGFRASRLRAAYRGLFSDCNPDVTLG